MKKVLSFVLVLALILGSVSMAFAAPAAAPSKAAEPFEDAKTSYVATILRDMGVLTGAGGKAFLDETITRAEFCAMILRSLGLEDFAKAKQETKFSDVPKEKWYSGYVATANNQGLVGGYPDGTFLPEETVTANEAIAFVVKALGYSAEHLDGVWPTNFQLKAKDLGIIPAGYDYATDGAKRGVVFEVLLNGLDCQIVKWNDKQGEYKNQNTTMGTRLGLPSNFTGVLSGASPLYRIASITVSSGETFGNGFDAGEFAGQTLGVLQKDNGAATNAPAGVYTNIGLSEATTRPLSGKFSSDAPIGAATTFTAVDKTVYTVVAGAANDAKYYRNGEELTSAGAVGDCTSKVSVEINAEFNPDKATEITTISSIAYSIKTGTTMVTASEAALLAEGKIASMAGLATALKDVTSSAVVEGDVAKLTDIQEKDVVAYYANLAGVITRLVVTRNVVKGPVTGINVTTKTYTMNGTGYVDGGYGMTVTPNAAGVKAASEYAFYLDSANKIYDSRWADEGAPAAASVNYKYAFVLESTCRSIYRLVGEEMVPTTNSSIRILPVGETTELTFEFVTPGATSTTGVMVPASYAWIAAITPEAIVKYALNDDGKLIYLEQFANFKNADKFDDSKAATATKIPANGLDGKLYTADAVVVVLQTSASITNTMAAAYSVKTVADVVGTTYAGVIYKSNSAGKISTLILKSAVAAPSTTSSAVVAILNEQVDANGTYYNMLKDGVAYTKYTSMASTAFTADQIVKIELENDKVTSLQAVNVATSRAFTTTKGLSVSDGVVTATAPASTVDMTFSVLNPVIYAYKTGGFTVATDLSAALSAGKKANFYDLNGDGFFELVVIDGTVK